MPRRVALAITLGVLAACGPSVEGPDSGSLFDAAPPIPPLPPLLEPLDSPVPWPVAIVRGRADGARRVIVQGGENPLATAILPGGSFCMDVALPTPGTYTLRVFSQADTGLLSETAAETTIVFDPAVGPIPGVLTCTGADPRGCSGAVEICGNLRDDDCNGLVDNRDPACATCADDLLEPNDDALAPRIAPIRYDGLMLCPGNQDFYGIYARVGDTIAARLFFTHASGNLDMELLDLDRVTQIQQATSLTDNEVLSHVVTVEGQYVLRVYAASGASNTYTLGLIVTPG